MFQRLDILAFSPSPPSIFGNLWYVMRRRLSRSALSSFLIASMLLPAGFLIFVFQDERMQTTALYLMPLLVLPIALAAYAWRRLEQLERTIDLRTQALTDALKEKEQLLKEVHHRVKNNMQIVSSLIRMQERMGTSPEETIRRVQAMALVHDLIYTQGEFASVDLTAYTQRLCKILRDNDGGRTTFRLSLESVTIALDRAMPFALILSETVTNAIKHASATSAGTVAITLATQKGAVKLTVSDNGTALNPEVDGRGFGFRLVESLSAQLDAITSFEREDGTTFQMTFPAE